MVGIKDIKRGSYIVWNDQPFLVKDISVKSVSDPASAKAGLDIENIFTGELISINIGLLEEIKQADISRRCASIISKQKDKIEIIDAVSFETIKADIKKELLDLAEENDQVTYIQFRDTVKVLEIRKQH